MIKFSIGGKPVDPSNLKDAMMTAMLQDIRAGRRTEVDAMNGAVVRYGRESGIATPTNEILTLLIKALEPPSQRGGNAAKTLGHTITG